MFITISLTLSVIVLLILIKNAKKEILYICIEDKEITLFLSDDIYLQYKYDSIITDELVEQIVTNRAFELHTLVSKVIIISNGSREQNDKLTNIITQYSANEQTLAAA